MTRRPSIDGRVARIERGAVHDGPGLRTVVFLKGCPLRCGWCHSPETQSTRPEAMVLPDRCLECGACADACERGAAGPATSATPVDRARCIACGECVDACPARARAICGQPVSVDDVVRDILRDRTFYDVSSGGVTISGGEPLLQPDFTLAMLERCRAEHVHTALQTCGHVKPAALRRAATIADLVMFDLKIVDETRHRRATRVSNWLILDNLRALASLRRDLVIRVPLVPGINDDWRNLAEIGAFVDSVGLARVDVLPYHRAGIAKYGRLGREYPLEWLPPAPAESLTLAVDTLKRAGLDVRVGGS